MSRLEACFTGKQRSVLGNAGAQEQCNCNVGAPTIVIRGTYEAY